MTEIHLDEKTITELDYIVGNVKMEANPEEGIPKRILKQWWVAKVKKLEEALKELEEWGKKDNSFRDATICTFALIQWLRQEFPLKKKDFE